MICGLSQPQGQSATGRIMYYKYLHVKIQEVTENKYWTNTVTQ
jgi:hypothetical protein